MTDLRVILLAFACVACIGLMCIAIDDAMTSKSKMSFFANCIFVVFFAVAAVLVAFKSVDQYQNNAEYNHGI